MARRSPVAGSNAATHVEKASEVDLDGIAVVDDLKARPSQPIDIAGNNIFLSSRPDTPKQVTEGRRPSFLRQPSDLELSNDIGKGGVVELAGGLQPEADLQITLGSWAGRQQVFPLPDKPAGFPPATHKAKVVRAQVAHQPPSDPTEAAWRYRFRHKWRREQLRALVGGPDLSPTPLASADFSADDDDLMWQLDDIEPAAPSPPLQPPPVVPKSVPPCKSSDVAPPAPADKLQQRRSLNVVIVKPLQVEYLPPLTRIALPPVKTELPPAVQAQQQADTLQRHAPCIQAAGELLEGAVPGTHIRRVVMRGASGKLRTPQRKWAPSGHVSPPRASQAA